MTRSLCQRVFGLFLCVALLSGAQTFSVFAQARRVPPTSDEKKNKRPTPGQEKGDEKAEQQEPLPTDIAGKDTDTVKVSTNVVNVDAVVYNKKTGQITTGLTKKNFEVYVDGVKRDITNFATPDAPITITLVVEYSKLGELFGYYGSGGQEPGTYEVIRPTAYFLSQFITPQDYVSVIAYDMRPTPITDFTNNPARIQQVIQLLLNNHPAFIETNMYDALKLTLVGGRADSVVLEDSKARTSEYAGMVAVPNDRRKAVLLVASGIDTFSKINFDNVRKIIQNAGIPIYIIGTAQMFVKKYGEGMDPGHGINIMGVPMDRMTFLQADNTMKTFAKETGGAYFPVTFEGELPTVLSSINGLLRNQYSLGFSAGDVRDGKPHKILVKVDVDGDGTTDEKAYKVQSREVFIAPKADMSKQ
jgi:Ca-activated chloride channel homolog